TINISRATYTEAGFKDEYKLEHVLPKQLTVERIKRKTTEYYQTKAENPVKSIKKFIADFLPIFHWMSHYKFKEWTVFDIVCGITVGFMQIPQGLSYALLAGQHPVYGMYTSFFPVIVYSLFGTSKHISMGCFTITSLMLGSAVSNAVPDPVANVTASQAEQDALWKEVYDERIMLGTAAALLSGVFLLGMSILRLGFIVTYFSDAMSSGFIFGNAVQAFVSQLKGLFGVSVGSYSGPLNIIWKLRDVIVNLTTLDASGRERVSATVVISAVCIIFLLGVKAINEKFKKKFPFGIPIPAEIIVVILGTGISYAADLTGNFGVQVIGEIPSGIPVPKPPDSSQMSTIIGTAIPIAIVGYAVAISISNIFGNAFGYRVRPNQELVAIGMSNIVSSFFFCFPSFPSMSRSCVQVESGGKTQLVGLVSSGVMLLVLLWIGQLFRTIPNACLASIVVVAIKGMLTKVRDLPPIWKVSKLDGIVWVVTMLATIFLDVVTGLVVGVLVSLLCIVFRTQMIASERLLQVDDTEIYRKSGSFPQSLNKEVVVLAFKGAMHFANKQYLTRAFIRCTGIDPVIELSRKRKLDAIRKQAMEDEEQKVCIEYILQTVDAIICSKVKPKQVKCVVLDCSLISFMDSSSVNLLIKTFNDYNALGVKILLANVCSEVAHVLKVGNFIKEFGDGNIFLTVYDAVTWWQSRDNMKSLSTRL
uniref:STAS domain-containing protein n=1 Tax=Ciona savignyi TaxID=51511 RepID=H2ZFJ5_CIOSA